MRKRLTYFLLIVLVLVAAAVCVLMEIDFDPPIVEFTQDLRFITRSGEIKCIVEDQKSGLRSLRVVLRQGDHEKEIFREEFSQKGVHRKVVSVAVKTRLLGLKEGKASLAIWASDHSILTNEVLSEQEIIIDTRPPRIELASLSHYVNVGGSCLVLYYVSKDATKNGVRVGDLFFKGYPITSDGLQAAYFGLPWDSSKDSAIMIEARDEAGNAAKLTFPYLIIKKKFKTDRINISDNFLKRKMPEFMARYENLGDNHLDAYLTINRELRRENNLKIKEVCGKSNPERLWEGPFLRMKGSPRAFFADHRIYYHNGKEIDRQIHLGIDIAALKHHPVGAANRGIIVFCEYLGIYGNTIIIDHGQNLFSIYSHLSSYKVKMGDEVTRGKIIGYTGVTGLAGGDHLHFGMLMEGLPVNPTEWWDAHWIKDNITIKLGPYVTADYSKSKTDGR